MAIQTPDTKRRADIARQRRTLNACVTLMINNYQHNQEELVKLSFEAQQAVKVIAKLCNK